MTLRTASLLLAIAYRLHGTDSAVVHACYAIRDRIDMRYRSLINRGMRCRSPSEWVENIEREMGW